MHFVPGYVLCGWVAGLDVAGLQAHPQPFSTSDLWQECILLKGPTVLVAMFTAYCNYCLCVPEMTLYTSEHQ